MHLSAYCSSTYQLISLNQRIYAVLLTKSITSSVVEMVFVMFSNNEQCKKLVLCTCAVFATFTVMSRVRLGQCERNIIFILSKRGWNFFEKKKKGPKNHYFALKLCTGASKLYSWASKSRVGVDPGPAPPSLSPPSPVT